MKKQLLTLAAVSILASNSALAKITASQAEQLGTTLTPVGAQMAGSKDGSIPAWKKLDKSVTEQARQGTVELYADEKPLFTIDQSNYKQHADKLSAGQVKLFETYPTFKMNVYPSHRTATLPEAIYQNTQATALTAELAEGGNGIKGAYNSIPFPIPGNGLEALWNHMVRFRGVYNEQRYNNIVSYKNGSFAKNAVDLQILFNFNRSDLSEAELDNLLLFRKSTSRDARKAGQATLVHETLNQIERARGAWTYNPGRRRVRRSPSLAYDAPVSAADGLRTTDDTDMFNGAPDRFNWELKGQQELYIPYNNEKLLRKDGNLDELATAGHLNPELTRYELHRVWVVEGTLKEGSRHIYSKRTFYLDEDSWSIAVADQYDNQGDLWRVSMAYLYNAYQLPAILSSTDVFHDLQAKRYFAYGLIYGESSRPTYADAAPSKNAFTPNSLRQRGAR